MADMGVEPKKILVWTVGPASYHPSNYYGDRHNGPGVTHVTSLGMNSNEQLMRTLIHEAAHGALGVSDQVAEELENACLGDHNI